MMSRMKERKGLKNPGRCDALSETGERLICYLVSAEPVGSRVTATFEDGTGEESRHEYTFTPERRES